jgi:hypothetical protein
MQARPAAWQLPCSLPPQRVIHVVVVGVRVVAVPVQDVVTNLCGCVLCV